MKKNVRSYQTQHYFSPYSAKISLRRNLRPAHSAVFGGSDLIRFRQLTQRRRARVSTPLNDLKRNYISPLGVFKSSFADLATLNICQERKARRRVLFALGKNGGNHKPPTFTLKSLVRC